MKDQGKEHSVVSFRKLGSCLSNDWCKFFSRLYAFLLPFPPLTCYFLSLPSELFSVHGGRGEIQRYGQSSYRLQYKFRIFPMGNKQDILGTGTIGSDHLLTYTENLYTCVDAVYTMVQSCRGGEKNTKKSKLAYQQTILSSSTSL